jgi:hypothetical protein
MHTYSLVLFVKDENRLGLKTTRAQFEVGSGID